MKKILLIIMLMLVIASSTWAIPITGTGTLGSFSGSFTYSFTNDTSASIIVSLTNTSPVANGGYLTAFAFNNPNNSISGATLSSTSPNFSLIGTPDFNNSISGSPFGDFDAGATSTDSSWLGGGNPTGGIAVGGSETFSFSLTGSGLSSLTTQDFINELSSSSDSGQNYWFAARFRGFEDGGSDKVPADDDNPPIIPEPTTILLLGSGLLGLFGLRKKFNK